MNALFAVDGWLVLQFERFAHMTQRWFGWTNFTWSRVFPLLWVGLAAFEEITKEKFPSGWLAWVAILAYVMNLFSVWDEKEAEKRLEKGVANSRKSSDVVFRVFILCFFAWDGFRFGSALFGNDPQMIIASAFAFLETSCFLFFWYFLACDPLPPCRGKIGEWLGSFFAQPAVAGSPA